MNIRFTYGPDAERQRLAAAELVGRYRTKHGTACNLHMLDLSGDSDAEQLDRILRYPSFFDDATFVTVRGAFSSKPVAKGIVETLKRFGDLPNTVVLVREEGTTTELKRASSALFTFLTGPNATAREYESLTGTKLVSWMQEFCEERGCRLGSAEARLVIERIGAESAANAAELAKLCAYAGSGPITTDSIGLLTVPTDAEHNAFALTDALAQRDKRSALRELRSRLDGGDAPHALLALYAFVVRNLLMISSLLERNTPPRTIAKTTGLHPFVVTKTVTAARQFSKAELERSHAWLAHADRETKTGHWDATDALYDFILTVV